MTTAAPTKPLRSTNVDPVPERQYSTMDGAERGNASATLLPSPRRTRQRRPVNVKLLLLVAVMVGLVSGTLYGFGRYSLALKQRLGIGQLQLQQFGILMDCGSYIGHPLTGYVYDHFGPRVSCVGAAIIVCCSYSAIAIAVSFHDDDDDDDDHAIRLLMCHVGFFGVGFGSGLGYIAGLGSVTKEFLGKPTLSRAVAAVAAGYGLSSTLVGVIFHRVPNLHAFFLFWGVLVAAVNLIGAVVFAKEEEEGEEEQVYAVMDDGIANSNNNENGNISPSASTIDSDNSGERDVQQLAPDANNLSVSWRDSLRDLSASWRDRPWAWSVRLQSWTTWKRLDFWMLFASFACVTGCGLFVINNLSTMVQSIGQPDALAGHLLFLLSICNVGGRVLAGALADLPCARKVGLLQGAAVVMFFGLLVGAASPSEGGGDSTASMRLAVTVGCVLTAYGGSWVLIVGILVDRYGRTDFGKDYGLMAMGPALSGLVFNSVSAVVYERHAEADGDGDGVCYGNECYRGSYWMAACAALVGGFILNQMPRTTGSSSIRPVPSSSSWSTSSPVLR